MNTPTLGVSAETGLDISGVIYNYTAVKDLEDDFTVTVGNKDLDEMSLNLSKNTK